MYRFAVDPSGQRSWGSTGNPSACLWRTWWCCRWNQSRMFWQPSWFRAGPVVYLCSNTHTMQLTTQEENLGTITSIYLNCATVLTPRTVDLPVSQSQRRQLLSADPVKTFLVSPESGQVKETADGTTVDILHRHIQFQINTSSVIC